MFNISRSPFEMLAVASFVNLKNLYISPHNIGPDLVMCFGTNVNRGPVLGLKQYFVNIETFY
jgi:hypothetical protein